MPIRLDPSWPGLDLQPEETRVDPDTLDGVAGAVMSLHYAQMDGYTPNLSYLRNAQMGEGDHLFGDWPTAGYMERGLEDARAGIEYYFGVLDQQVEAAAELFGKTAEEYRDLDQGIKTSLEEATTEGWDRLATPADAPGAVGPSAGTFQDTTMVTGIMAPEDTSNYNVEEVLDLIRRVKEAETWRSLGLKGDTYAGVSETLNGFAVKLKAQAQTLAAEWNSETAVAAQKALQLISATAEHLAESSQQVADYAHESATALQNAVADFPDDSGVNWLDDANDFMTIGSNPAIEARHNEIREKLATLNEAYTHINNLQLPKQVDAALPQLTDIPPRPPRPPHEQEWGPGSGSGIGGGPGYSPGSPGSPIPPAGDFTPSGAAPDSYTGVAQVPGSGSGFAGGGPGELGGTEIPGLDDQDWSTGGLAGAGPGGPGAVPGGIPGGVGGGPGGAGPGGLGGGLGPGGVTPGGAGGVPGGGPGAVGPGGVGMVPGAAGRGGAGAGRPGAGGGAGRAGAVPGAGGLGRGGAGAGGAGAGGVGRGGGVMGAPIAGAGAGAGGRGAGGRAGGGGGPGAGRPGSAGGAGGAVGGRAGGSGGGAAGAGAGAGGAAGGRGVAGGMMPMAGGGRGSDKQRHSQPDSWLVEDDNPWQPDDEVPPGVIR